MFDDTRAKTGEPITVDGVTVVADLHRLDWTSPASSLMQGCPVRQLCPPYVIEHWPGSSTVVVAIEVERATKVERYVSISRWKRAGGAWHFRAGIWFSPIATSELLRVLPAVVRAAWRSVGSPSGKGRYLPKRSGDYAGGDAGETWGYTLGRVAARQGMGQGGEQGHGSVGPKKR